MATRRLQEPPRGPREVPREPQEAPRGAQGTPRRTPEGPRAGPREPQDGPKTIPSRLQLASHSHLTAYFCEDASKGRPRAPRRPQEAAKRSPRGPQEASQRPPRGPQEGPKRHQKVPKRLSNTTLTLHAHKEKGPWSSSVKTLERPTGRKTCPNYLDVHAANH